MTSPDPTEPLPPGEMPGYPVPGNQPISAQPPAQYPGQPPGAYPSPQGAYPSPQGGYPPPGYAPAYAAAGGPYPQNYGVDAYGRPLSDKSKVVAGVLQIALGGFGVGRFYIGDNRTAILQIVVTVFTCGLGHFWGVVDGIMILVNGGTDAQGRVLHD